MDQFLNHQQDSQEKSANALAISESILALITQNPQLNTQIRSLKLKSIPSAIRSRTQTLKSSPRLSSFEFARKFAPLVAQDVANVVSSLGK
jgi:hypothetical protein